MVEVMTREEVLAELERKRAHADVEHRRMSSPFRGDSTSSHTLRAHWHGRAEALTEAIDLVSQMAPPARDPDQVKAAALLAECMQERPFAIGDRVQLKSGGFVGTVSGSCDRAGVQTRVTCDWPDGCASFPPDMLKRVEEGS